MKKSIHVLISMATAVIIAAGAASCEYKELDEPEYNSPSFLLNFVFEHVDSIPNDYLVVFYPMDDNNNIDESKGYYVREINGKAAYITGIPAGNYKITAWNKFLEHTRVDINSDRNKTVAYAQQYFTTADMPIKVLDSLYHGQTIMDTPDYMTHANEENFELLNGIENQRLTLYPDSMVVTVEYRLRGVKSLGMAKQIKAAVNNVARYRYPAFDNNTKDTCTVMFDCRFDAQDSLIYGNFYVFGIEPQELSKLSHKMVLFFWLNGNNIYLPIDVTQAFRAYKKDDKKILIEMPDLNIDLKDYIPTSGTFDVDINSWEDVDIEISW